MRQRNACDYYSTQRVPRAYAKSQAWQIHAVNAFATQFNAMPGLELENSINFAIAFVIAVP
jgi:hypothetical protein